MGKEVPRHLNEEGQSGLRRAISSQQLKLSGGQYVLFFLPLSFWVIFSLKLSYYLPLQHFWGRERNLSGLKGVRRCMNHRRTLRQLLEKNGKLDTCLRFPWMWHCFPTHDPQSFREAWEPIKSHKSLSSHVNILLQNSITVVWWHKTSFVFDVPQSFPHKADIASRKVNKVMGKITFESRFNITCVVGTEIRLKQTLRFYKDKISIIWKPSSES